MAVEFREKCWKVHISINSIYRILKEINWRSVRMFVDFRGDFLENKTKRRYSCIYFFTSVLFFLQKSGSFSASGGCRHPWQAGRDGGAILQWKAHFHRYGECRFHPHHRKNLWVCFLGFECFRENDTSARKIRQMSERSTAQWIQWIHCAV